MFKKLLSSTVITCFFLTTLGPLPQAHAEVGAYGNTPVQLQAPGTMINLSPAYEPVIIKGLTVHKDNPFLFDFIVDVGQDKMSGEPLKKEGEKLIKYFLASLAIPDKDVWVNLSPYEKDRMVPEVLGQTDMGRDLLEQDYILKQITASLIYPEKDLGKKFWDKVYAKAQHMYGTTQVPVNTFNKVWIMADRAEVFEHNQTAFVVDSHLKVMLEEDYLALEKNQRQPGDMALAVSPSRLPSDPGLNVKASQRNHPNALASQIIKAIILPELEKEVNTGKNFANLHQILNSLILANWYKKNLKQALLNQVYTNQSKVKGIDLNDPTVKQRIYEQYLKAYKKGVFNYIKEDVITGDTVPRKYFSGGFVETQAVIDPARTTNPAMLVNALPRENERLVDLATLASTDAAMANIKTLYDKVPPARRVDFSKIDGDRTKQINKQIKEAVGTLKMMIDFYGSKGTVPNEREIQGSLVDTSVFHPALFNDGIQAKFGVGQDIAPTFVFDGSIFKTYPGEKKPYRIALTLGKDFIAVTTTYSDLPDYKDFTSWIKEGILSPGFDTERFLLAKGGLRVYQEEKNLNTTLMDKLRGIHNNKPALLEGADLTRGMGDKNPPAGVFFEGGKAILITNKGADPKQATKELATSTILDGVLGRLYDAGPDVNSGTGTGIMGVLQKQADWVHKALGLPQIPVTTSIEGEPASFDHEKWTVTSISAFESFMAVFKDPWIRERYSIKPKVAFEIQGFGDVGSGLPKYIKDHYPELLDDGTITIIAVSDMNGGIHDPNGLDVGALLRLKEKKSLSVREDYKKLTGKNVNEFDNGSDVFYVRSQFPQGADNQRTVIAFPAAVGTVFSSPEDIEKLKASGVGMVISPANNPLKEDIGLEGEFEEKGILFLGPSLVSFGGIYTSTEEIFYNMYEGGTDLFGKKVSDAMDGWKAYIQDGIVNMTMSLVNFEMEEFKREIQEGRITTFDKIHKELAAQIRSNKNHILGHPGHPFLNRIAREVKAVFNQYQKEGRNLTTDEKDEIALIIILKRVVEEACVNEMYGGTYNRQDFVNSHVSVLENMLINPGKDSESTQRRVIYELGRMAAENARESLLRIIKSSFFNDGIKRTVAEALANIGLLKEDVKVLSALAKGTDSPSLRFVLERTADRIDNTDDAAMTGTDVTKPSWVQGGIDLNISSGMQWKVSKDGNGVEMNVDPAMIERMKRDGVNWLSPVILKMTLVTNVWLLLGLHAPAKDESLAGV